MYMMYVYIIQYIIHLLRFLHQEHTASQLEHTSEKCHTYTSMPSYQILHEAGVFVLRGDHALEGEEAAVVHSQGDLAGLAEGLRARL